ncbi:hypothetical protein ACWCRG_42735, partial [Streptomyces formicae]
MAARNTARKRAFQILFEADQRGTDVLTVLADWVRHSRSDSSTSGQCACGSGHLPVAKPRIRVAGELRHDV